MPKQKNNNNHLGRAIMRKIDRKRQQIVANKPVIFIQQSEENHELIQKQKLKSVLQENPMAQFLHVAELSNQNFQANRNIKFKEVRQQVNTRKIISGKSAIKQYQQQQLDEQHKAIFLAAEKSLREQHLQLPERPKWDNKTTKQALQKAQNQSYLKWRRSLALIEEKNNVHITPYEKNLQVWKQLWRVVERSDLLIQIVDGRDPLFFFCQGLFDYIQSLNNQQKQRQSLILINKSDLTSQKILNQWNQYLIKNQINHIFFSAKQKNQQPQEQNIDNSQVTNDNSVILENEVIIAKHLNTPNMLSIKQLTQFLTAYQCKFGKEKIEVGMIGYPNVGKSSVINALLGQKKVGVASMPGKTKHFQTLILNDNVTLVDCPGLVFPKIASSAAYMMLNGLYPLDTIKDYYTPIKVLVNRIPKNRICKLYSLHWKQPDPYTVDNLLDKYATLKGYFGGSGLPNQAVAARSILKDYVTGALVFSQVPPGFKRQQEEMQNELKEQKQQKEQKLALEKVQQQQQEKEQKIQEAKCMDQQQKTEKQLDEQFFTQQLKNGNKNQQDVIQMLSADDILDLIDGKKIGGIKLSKDVKRQIKYALKRGEDLPTIKKNYLGSHSTGDRKTCVKVQ